LWDYGRPREIHVEKAVPICDLTVHPGAATPRPVAPGREELVRSKHFVTESVRLRAGERVAPIPANCQIWICLEGKCEIGGAPCGRGDMWLLPDAGDQPEIRALADTRFLRTCVP
jgi:CxxC motif-containing protein